MSKTDKARMTIMIIEIEKEKEKDEIGKKEIKERQSGRMRIDQNSYLFPLNLQLFFLHIFLLYFCWIIKSHINLIFSRPYYKEKRHCLTIFFKEE